MYSSTQLRTCIYKVAAFSGMDFPEIISSPVQWFRSICGVLGVESISKLFKAAFFGLNSIGKG
jgi:hypothetical protein